MAINFNTGPYFDDFNPDKNFYKVLFKPGYAVQARELNQLQSILQHQISSVGNHLFKKNTVVIPGGIALITNADIVSITNINDPSVLVGKTITNASSFDYTDDTTLDGYITAVVIAYKAATTSAPAALYVKYFKTQTDGRQKFNLNEQLKTVDSSLVTFNVDSTVGSTVGKVATVSKGTFYTKEIFVDTIQQSIIVETYTDTATNCTLGLSVVESIVTSDQDSTLLDNANGYPNQYAPGADRYKISLVLARIDAATTIDDDNFITMMKIENNVVTLLNNRTQYAEIMSMLARRTYDANGNFIVNGLETSVTAASDDEYVWANINPGKCYVGGYEYEQLAPIPIAITKPRDVAHQRQMPTTTKYSSGMAYFFAAGGAYLKEIPESEALVQFLNAAPGTSGLSVIGYGVFKSAQFYLGVVNSTDVYKLFFEYISLNEGYTIDDIGGMRSTTSAEGAPILHEINLNNVIGTFAAGHTIQSGISATQTGLVYNYTNTYAYVIKNTLNPIPFTDTIKDITSNATASRRKTFITNYSSSFIPMIEVDDSTVKTLYNQTLSQNPTTYSVINKDEFIITSPTTYETPYTLGANDVFDEFSNTSYFAYITTPGSEQIVDLSTILTITSSGKKYQLVIPVGSPMIGKTVSVYSTINKTLVGEAPKTLVTLTAGLTIPTPSKSWMALGHQDVVNITKIVEGKTVAVNSATWNTNEVTFGTPSTAPHGLVVGDTIVVSGVVSSNNTTGAYNSGYNKTYTVATVISTTYFTVALTSNPGTYTSGGLIALPPNINTDTDITSRYIFESGNTPYMCGTGLIKLKKGPSAPQGQISVQYRYYTVGSGNYISVDSYGSYSGDLSYIGDIPNITGPDDNPLEVRRYIDFRTRTSSYFFKNIGVIEAGSAVLKLRDLNLTSHRTALVGKYVVGPSHPTGVLINSVAFNPTTGNTELTLASTASTLTTNVYYIGLHTSSLSLSDSSAGGKSFPFPKDSTRITYQYVKFLPKNVMVYIDRTEDSLGVQFKEVSGINEVLTLRENQFKLPILYMSMSPYTVSIRDIDLQKIENPVYHMIDIHAIKKQVDRTEYYAAQALSRNIHQEIIDASNETLTTASRGIWAEDFMDMSSQDYNSDDFACTIYDKSYVSPGVVTRTINLQHDATLNTTTWMQTGNFITLPYSEVRAFGNSNASRFNNLNPFTAINWTGKLVLNPSVDNWVDTTVTPAPTIVNTTITPIANPTTSPGSTVVTIPPPVVPQPAVEEIVTEITNLRTSWGPDTLKGYHAITFDWRTNLGRTGRVNTDVHISPAIAAAAGVTSSGTAQGASGGTVTAFTSNLLSSARPGYDGTYARSLINKRYNETGVKEYLNAGAHFDTRPPDRWW